MSVLSARSLAVLGVVMLSACHRSDDAAARATEARAQEVLRPFKENLQSALMGALSDGGPEAAIDVCAVVAPDLAATASKDGVRMGRAAVRRRNPGNRPPPWAAASLDELVRAPKEGAHRTIPLGGGRMGYVEAIVTKPVCLTCHGESTSPAVRARIATRYPQDEATGFREGDLRGVFWVELPAP